MRINSALEAPVAHDILRGSCTGCFKTTGYEGTGERKCCNAGVKVRRRAGDHAVSFNMQR